MLEVNNGNIGTTCEICLKLTILWTYFTTGFSVSIPDPEQVNTSWVLGANFTDKIKAFFHLLKSDANSEPVANLGGRFCENI